MVVDSDVIVVDGHQPVAEGDVPGEDCVVPSHHIVGLYVKEVDHARLPHWIFQGEQNKLDN